MHVGHLMRIDQLQCFIGIETVAHDILRAGEHRQERPGPLRRVVHRPGQQGDAVDRQLQQHRVAASNISSVPMGGGAACAAAVTPFGLPVVPEV